MCLAKQTRVKFSKKAEYKTGDKLDYIHSDLWGPNRVPSKSDARYFMTLIDDYSRMAWVYFLEKTKDEAFLTFVKWKTMVERQMERNVKRLRTDNGDGKLETRAKKCIFLGYATRVKGYRLWYIDQKTPGLIINRDVTFNESASLDSQMKKAITETNRGVSDRIELEIESPLAQPSSSKGEEVEETEFANVVDGNLLGYTNPVGFALAVAETVDAFECYSYPKVISGTEPNRRISTMAEDIESLNKFRHCLDLIDVCGNG
nr:uncharacterized protein LOC104092345 [Nicotiana tomentosiformis]